MALRRLVCSVLFLGIGACAGGQSTPLVTGRGLVKAVPATPKTVNVAKATPPGALSEASSLAVFDQVVGMVRRYHVFAPQTEKNLGKTWEAELPRLRAEFAAAKDTDALIVALHHFGNSLHDAHCTFRPKDRGGRLKLGFRVDVEKTGDGYQFYVDRVGDESLRGRIEPGDIVVATDGVPGAKLIDEYDLVSNMNSKDNIAIEIANTLTSRRSALTSMRAGMTSTFTLRSRRGGDERKVAVAWKKGANSDDDSDFALNYASKDCVNADAKDYGNGYTLAARGYRVCIYTSKEPRYRDYPIVRQVAFRYDEVQHGPLADFDLISKTLAAAKPKGVLLDVQDNRGGINPNLFIEWWTDKPYTDTETRMVLDETLLRDEKGDVHISSVNDAVAAWYASELGSHPASGARRISSARPFMCKPDTCIWDNHYAPNHRVTKAPVALIVGPNCVSSCDALAWHFAKDGIGPIVGRQPMAGFTTHRARFDVAVRPGEPALGTIDLAISYDTAPGGNDSIEGVPLKIDVPVARTFENRDRYDRVLVESAIHVLEKSR